MMAVVWILGIVVRNEEDEQYLLKLYEEYYPIIRKSIMKVLGDDIEVDDIINETFIRLLNKVDTLHGLEKNQLVTYLVYAGKHTAIDFIKHRDMNNKYLYLVDGIDQNIAHFNTPETEYLHIEEAQELSEIILSLPAETQDLLIYRYYLGRSIQELAAALGIKEDSVWKRIQRAKKQARNILKKRGKKYG